MSTYSPTPGHAIDAVAASFGADLTLGPDFAATAPGMTAANGDVLVVSKVSDTETCHVAYIDALANPDAIALARQVADKQTKSFDCRQEPHTEGGTGRSPM